MKFVKDLLTLANGEDYDIGRVAGLAGLLLFCALSVADFYTNHKFDPQAWGLGFGLLVSGIGAGLALKHKTEPQ